RRPGRGPARRRAPVRGRRRAAPAAVARAAGDLAARPGRADDRADYREVGGIAGGVAQSAEEASTQLSAQRQELVRRIFLRLVHVAPDLADTRRRVDRAELSAGADSIEVLDLFVARRLLTVD